MNQSKQNLYGSSKSYITYSRPRSLVTPGHQVGMAGYRTRRVRGLV